MKSTHCNENKIYAREFHAIKNNKDILALDIENIKLIQLNDIELAVLNGIKEEPASMLELKKRFSSVKGKQLEEAVNELMSVNMFDYSPIKEISREDIEDFERNQLKKLRKSNLMQIALNVTHKCNLNCDYCYGGDGSYGGPAIHMSKDTARQAVDFLMKASGDLANCRITFFGGEPLLNFDLVKYVVQYAKKEALRYKKKIHFGMTTNGVLLDDDKIDFLIKENIEVTFSFDGPKKVQDKNRPFKSGKKKSSFDIIYPKILKFIEKAEKDNGFYFFRSTLTRSGIMNINDMADFFNSFKTKDIYYDIAEYKKGMSAGGLAISQDDLEIFRQKVKEVADSFKKNNFKDDLIFSGALKSIQERTKQKHSCISPGSIYAGVSAQGDIFPCHRFAGYKETKLGNVWEGYDRDKWLEKYAKVHIFSSKVCSRCWMRYFCGGMCPATNYFLGGDLVLSENLEPEPVHCALKKIIFEEAMLLYASLSAAYHGPKVEGQNEQSIPLAC